MVPGSAAVSYPNQLRTSIMQLAANGMLQDNSPKTNAVVELLLGAPVAYKLRDVEEPGDRAVAEINIMRVQQGQEPFFKPWMNHQKHIEVLLTAMRDPKEWKVLRSRVKILLIFYRVKSKGAVAQHKYRLSQTVLQVN